MKCLFLFVLMSLAACDSSWTPTALVDGYRIMVMNSKEIYVANSQNELLLGPTIKKIGMAPGIIVVDCGQDETVANGFSNTVGLNLIDTKTGSIRKRLTLAEAQEALAVSNQKMSEMRDLSSYLK